MSDYRDLLEPGAAAEAPHPTNWTGGPNEAVLTGAVLSLAVSMRRIADAVASGSLPEGLHSQITHLAWEAGQSFGRGVELGRRG